MNPFRRVIRRACAGGFALGVGIAAAQVLPSDVVITATRTPQEAADVLSDLRVIDAATIERSAGLSLPELLQQQAGVEIASYGGPGQLASVFIRGTNADHVLLLVDGVRVNSATAGTNAFENIPLDQIERIEVLRGPASSLYGADAIGGVIQIFTKQGERTTARASVGSFGTASLSAGLGRRFGPDGATLLSLQAGASRSRAFPATTPALAAYYSPEPNPYRNRNLGLTLGQTLAPGQSLTLRGFYSDGLTSYDDYGNTRAQTHDRLSSLALESRNRLTPAWHSLLRLARGADHRADAAASPFYFDTDQDQATWQNDIGALGGQIAAGLEWRRERVASDTVFDRTERHVGSAFASYAASLGPQLLQASLRRDQDSQFGGRSTGNLAWGWRVAPALRLSASVGTAYKAPTFNDLYYPGFSNPALRPETSRSGELAARWDDGRLQASLTAFESRIRDLIQFDFVTSTPQNLDRARIRGATLGLGWTGPAWQARAEWTHQNPVDEATGQRLLRRARDHATASLQLTPGGPWSGGIDLVASSARDDSPYAPPPPRMGGYALVDLHAAYRLAPAWTLSLNLGNAADKRYELVRGYTTASRHVTLAIAYSVDGADAAR
ncbi:MAG: TonB-dependent receptor [Burkholderiales bacterium]|nr:TonB-dependent receptor [Burkholderiales bacterium]